MARSIPTRKTRKSSGPTAKGDMREQQFNVMSPKRRRILDDITNIHIVESHHGFQKPQAPHQPQQPTVSQENEQDESDDEASLNVDSEVDHFDDEGSDDDDSVQVNQISEVPAAHQLILS